MESAWISWTLIACVALAAYVRLRTEQARRDHPEPERWEGLRELRGFRDRS